MGFRGEEPPKKFNDYITIIAIGGSTTEGFYLNDKKTWPEILEKNISKDFRNIWINNAGLDGQSTFGHMVLLEDYILKIKPNIIIFYCGLNDIGLSKMNRYDNDMITKVSNNKIKHFINVIANKSEVIATTINIYHYLHTKNIGLFHGNLQYDKLSNREVLEKEIKKSIEEEKNNIQEYGNRIEKIIKLCKENHIKPVFISQAILCGSGKDLKTGKYLGNISIDNKFKNYYWTKKILEMYNKEMEIITKKNNVFFIDAYSLMPNSSKYYYDCVHFNEDGAEKFSEIITPKLLKFIQNNYNI